MSAPRAYATPQDAKEEKQNDSILYSQFFGPNHARLLVQFVNESFFGSLQDIIAMGIVINKNHPQGYPAAANIPKGKVAPQDVAEALTMTLSLDPRLLALRDASYHAILVTLDTQIIKKLTHAAMRGQQGLDTASLVTILAFVASKQDALAEFHKKMFALATEIYQLKSAAVKELFDDAVNNLIAANHEVVNFIEKAASQRPKKS